MKQKRKIRKKRIVIILLLAVLCAALVMTRLMVYGKAQMAKVPGLTFQEALASSLTMSSYPDSAARGENCAARS